MKTAILLSSYNGEKHISEQLVSILNQGFENFILYIRDDGSSDLSLTIIEEFRIKNPTKIIVLHDELGNIGVKDSFKLLMKLVTADYYFFADQDDIWELDKLEKLIKIAQESCNSDQAYLLFSNMSVFYDDESAEYDFFKKFNVTDCKIQSGLFQGTISGCLMLFNHKAKQQSLMLNTKSNMLHDWDMLMTCYLFGKIELFDEHFIKHRIHSNNVVGENLNKSVVILLKDFLKYAFKSYVYRKIILHDYFFYVKNCSINLNESKRIEKELFNESELNNLSYFKRKKWYLKHFNPFIYGKTKGTLILLTV